MHLDQQHAADTEYTLGLNESDRPRLTKRLQTRRRILMAPINELERFRTVWDREAHFTTQLLKSLPTDQYDFRPDPGGRSLGELAWHLCEIEGYVSDGISKGAVTFQEAPPNLQRPREVRLLAPGYRKVNEEAAARLVSLAEERVEREVA